MHKILPIVAIVGLPNVGKSTLMNKIAGNRLAVTSEISGTTRDRQYCDASWNGADFTLVDTAGMSLSSKDGLENSMNKQIEIALADVGTLVSENDAQLLAVPVHAVRGQDDRKTNGDG